MTKDLVKFYNNLKEINGVYQYEDSEGNYCILDDKKFLSVGVFYQELSEEELIQARFKQEIDKNIKLNTIKVNKPVDKSTITHKEKDKGTLIDKETEVYQVWICSNGLGLKSCFNTKEEALELAKKINKRLYPML